MAKKKGAAAQILEMARSAPGGVIRWSEAEATYIQVCGRRDGMNVGRVMQRYFAKVDGVRGFYVLCSSMEGEDQESDKVDLPSVRAQRMSEIQQ